MPTASTTSKGETAGLDDDGYRVKLYELEQSGSWVDRGVGHVTVMMVAALQGPALCIVSEETGAFLLQSKIQSDDLYERQGGTMILWKEADFASTIDYALSFQQEDGCTAIWNAINDVQGEYLQQREYGSIPSFARTQRIGLTTTTTETASDSDSYTMTDEAEQMSSQHHVYSILPVDLSSDACLPAIKQRLDHLHPSQRDYVSAQLLHEDCLYLKQLMTLFVQLEESHNVSSLVCMAEIFRSILLLNEPSIIEYLLGTEEIFLHIAGIFEYDASLRERGQYRTFLRTVQMQHVVALSREVHSAAHFLYRLKYLRDILLHPTIDDPGVSAINSMITFTSTEIASSVLADEAVIIAVLTYLLPTPAAAVPSSSSDTHCDDLHSNKTGNHEVPSSSSSANQSLHHTTSTSTAVSSSSGGSSDLEDKVQERVKVVNAVLFIRELFVLSKFVPLDKRMEIYRHFFAVHQKLFTSAVVYVLGGVSLMLRHDAEVYNSLHHASQTSPTQSQIPISESSPDDMHSFVKHFTYEEGLLACNAMAEVLSVISIVYPMAIRQMILTQSCHPAATKTSSGTSTTTTTSSIIRVEDGQQVDLSNKSQQSLAATALWYRQSLFYLLIDLLVNGIDIACLDFLGDCIRQVLDFDKIHALNTLFCAANNPRGGNPNALHNNPNNPNNHVNTHYISSKLDKETLLKLFYDHYIVFFFVIVNDDLTHNSSNSSSSNSNNTMKSVPSKYYVDKHQVSFQLDDSLQQDMTSYLPCTPQSTHAFVTSRRLIVDIFVLCLQQHSYRIKYCLLHGSYIHKFVYKSFPYVANTDSTGNALTTSHTTTTSNNRTLQVYIIKFLKAILLTKDEFYFKHIVKLDVLKPIFMTLQQVTHRDNLLTSAIYDLLDTIRQENIAVLMRYVVEKYHEVCEKITLVEVYDSLRLKHEQHLERSQVSNKMEEEDIENQGAAGGGAKKRGREGTAWRRREEEEDYFNSDDNESVDDDLLGIRWSGSQQDFGKRSRGDSSQSSPSTTSGIYARPPSPPHYNRLHGNELDGEGHSTIHGSSAPVSSPLTAIGDAMSIISQYADDDLSSQENDVPSEMTIEEVDSDASSTVTSSAVMTLNQEDFPTELELPPLSKKHEDDEVDELSLFLGHNRKKDTPTQDSTTSTSTSNIGNGISFVMLKKKPIITFSNKP